MMMEFANTSTWPIEVVRMAYLFGCAATTATITIVYLTPFSSLQPDPYYGGKGGFVKVLDMLDDACKGLLEYFKENSE